MHATASGGMPRAAAATTTSACARMTFTVNAARRSATLQRAGMQRSSLAEVCAFALARPASTPGFVLRDTCPGTPLPLLGTCAPHLTLEHEILAAPTARLARLTRSSAASDKWQRPLRGFNEWCMLPAAVVTVHLNGCTMPVSLCQLGNSATMGTASLRTSAQTGAAPATWLHACSELCGPRGDSVQLEWL